MAELTPPIAVKEIRRRRPRVRRGPGFTAERYTNDRLSLKEYQLWAKRKPKAPTERDLAERARRAELKRKTDAVLAQVAALRKQFTPPAAPTPSTVLNVADSTGFSWQTAQENLTRSAKARRALKKRKAAVSRCTSP